MPLRQKNLVVCLLLMFVLWTLRLTPLQAQSTDIQVPFYGASLTLPACPGMQIRIPPAPDAAFFQAAYDHFDACEYLPFLKKVGDYRRGMALSDWHFYEILCRAAEVLYPKESENFRVLFEWFMLRKSGIDARVAWVGNELHVHAPSEDIESGFYSLIVNGKRFMNLSACRRKVEPGSIGTEILLAGAPHDGASMGMDMRIRQFPHMIPSKTIPRLIEFTHKGKPYSITVKLNKYHLRILDEYPFYNQSHFFEMGLSPEAEASLLPVLEGWMRGMSIREQAEFLMSFTRTSFLYQDDQKCYGKEKPMAPEQTLFHTFSDCEDRSALFFYLCKKLIPVPAVVLDFETHVGVALEVPGVEGACFEHEGRRYSYCEPTGPEDALRIGEIWPEVKGQKVKIIAQYKPD